MPAFSPRLSDTAIWSTIEFIHAQAQANEARALNDEVEPWRPIVAPDFTFEIADRQQESLRDERGRHAILLVLYTLPQSLERLHGIDTEKTAFDKAQVRVIAVPFKPDGFDTTLPSFAAVAGADVGDVYSMFASDQHGVTPTHIEFLIDRHGYLRARWAGVSTGEAKRSAEVLAQAALLNAEPERTSAPEAHGH